MLQVVAPYVAEMLHLKSLTINRVAGVAGFQTISTCKPNLKSLNINMVVGVFDGFLSILPLSHPILWARMEDGGSRRNDSTPIQPYRAKSSRMSRDVRAEQCSALRARPPPGSFWVPISSFRISGDSPFGSLIRDYWQAELRLSAADHWLGG
jgi:hypothetical protein